MTAMLVSETFVLLLVAYAAWVTPALVRRDLPFGVRVPAERTDAPVVVAQRRAYRLRVLVAGFCVTAAAVSLAAVTGQPLITTAALFALLALCWAFYYRAHRAILASKEREHWYEGVRQGVAVDTTLRTAPERFPWAWLAPAVAILAATVVVGVVRYPHLPATLAVHYDAAGHPDRYAATSVWSAFSLVFVQAVLTALVVGLTVATFRARPDLDAARPATTARQHRRFSLAMARAMLLLAGCLNASLFLASWLVWDGTASAEAFTAATLVPVVVGGGGVVALAVRVGQGGSLLPADGEKPTGVTQRDDDRFWRGGLFYVNRDDPAILIPKRFGVGWTVNLGNPRSLLLLAATVAVVVSVISVRGS